MGLARSCAKGQDSFEVKGNTINDCKKELITITPGIKKSLFYGEKDLLRSTIQVTVNNIRSDAEGLLKQVKDGDHIQIKRKIR
jgi:hypothetical protein